VSGRRKGKKFSSHLPPLLSPRKIDERERKLSPFPYYSCTEGREKEETTSPSSPYPFSRGKRGKKKEKPYCYPVPCFFYLKRVRGKRRGKRHRRSPILSLMTFYSRVRGKETRVPHFSPLVNGERKGRSGSGNGAARASLRPRGKKKAHAFGDWGEVAYRDRQGGEGKKKKEKGETPDQEDKDTAQRSRTGEKRRKRMESHGCGPVPGSDRARKEEEGARRARAARQPLTETFFSFSAEKGGLCLAVVPLFSLPRRGRGLLSSLPPFLF